MPTASYMVRLPMYAVFVRRFASHRFRGAYLILFLCLCVILQMLGVPATLLDLAGYADLFAASTLEGLTLPPTIPTLYVHSGYSMPLDVPLTADVPILLTSLFRPPLI